MFCVLISKTFIEKSFPDWETKRIWPLPPPCGVGVRVGVEVGFGVGVLVEVGEGVKVGRGSVDVGSEF